MVSRRMVLLHPSFLKPKSLASGSHVCHHLGLSSSVLGMWRAKAAGTGDAGYNSLLCFWGPLPQPEEAEMPFLEWAELWGTSCDGGKGQSGEEAGEG